MTIGQQECTHMRRSETLNQSESDCSEVVDDSFGVQIASQANNQSQKPRTAGFADGPGCVDQSRGKGAFWRPNSIGGHHEQWHGDHRRANRLQSLPKIELITIPAAIEMVAADASRQNRAQSYKTYP